MIMLHTPGHGLFTDTLMMYSIASALRDYEINFSVTGYQTHYSVEVKASLDDAARALAQQTRRKLEETSDLLRKRKLLREAEMAALRRCLNKLSDEGGARDYLLELTSPNHSALEGRGKIGITMWLPLNPMIGKYVTGPYKYRSKSYGVCTGCIALSALGYSTATIIFRTFSIRAGKPASLVNVLLLSFEGSMNMEVLSSLLEDLDSKVRETDVSYQKFAGKARRAGNVALLPLSMAALAYLKGDVASKLAESAAKFKAVSLAFEIVRVLQIRGHCEVDVDILLSALSSLAEADERAKSKGERAGRLEGFRLLIENLLESDDANVLLEALWSFISSRTHAELYDAVRGFVKAADRLERSKPPNVEAASSIRYALSLLREELIKMVII